VDVRRNQSGDDEFAAQVDDLSTAGGRTAVDSPTASLYRRVRPNAAFLIAGFPLPSMRLAPTNAFALADVSVRPELLATTNTSAVASVPSMLLVRLLNFIELSLIRIGIVEESLY
jgi:hypothetical protein